MAIVFNGGKGEPGADAKRAEAPSPEQKGFVGMLDKAFDLLEKTTNTDLDGDGVIGARDGDKAPDTPAE